MAYEAIVTGGAGFIGSNLVRALNDRGVTDILVVDELDDETGKARNLADLRYVDYRHKTAFREDVLAGRVPAPTTVFHLGACSSTTATDEAYLEDNNTGYTRDLCEWCRSQGSRFIYASSAATYGDGSQGYSDGDALTPHLRPLNPYGWSKQRLDLWALENGALNDVVGIKYFNVYGPREDHKGDMRSLVRKAYRQIKTTGHLNLFRSHRPAYGDGEQKRDFVYVRDAVAVTLFFHDRPDVGGLFNCGTGEARTWLDLAHAIFAAMEREPDIRFIDIPEHIRDKYQYFTEADMDKLHAAGYAAPFTAIEDGVRDYVRNYLDNV